MLHNVMSDNSSRIICFDYIMQQRDNLHTFQTFAIVQETTNN